MRRMLIVAAVLGLTLIGASCKPRVAPQEAAKEVVEKFHKLETQGRWLGENIGMS